MQIRPASTAIPVVTPRRVGRSAAIKSRRDFFRINLYESGVLINKEVVSDNGLALPKTTSPDCSAKSKAF